MAENPWGKEGQSTDNDEQRRQESIQRLDEARRREESLQRLENAQRLGAESQRRKETQKLRAEDQPDFSSTESKRKK